MLSFEQAREQLLAAARPITDVEELPTQSGGGRILARPVVALVDVPPVDNAQMDGYAVRCSDAAAVPVTLPVALRIAAGQAAAPLPPGAAARIFTGAPIPAGADAVVMQEACRAEADRVTLLEAPEPGRWIRRRASDIALGAVALEAGQALRAQHLGIAASVGAARLGVARRPKVALFSTGDELAMPGDPPPPGDAPPRIFNSNRYVLAGLLQTLGCVVQDLGIVRDSAAATRAALASAAREADLILSSGGVSVGEEDHVKAAVAALGQLDLWQIAMRPGKPLAFGRVGAVPFIGLPGNPVASFVTFVLLVRPYLLRCLGVRALAPRPVLLPARFAWQADPQRREFLRVRLDAQGALERFPSQNSALLSSVAWADGLADVAPGASVTPGQAVPFLALSELTGPP